MFLCYVFRKRIAHSVEKAVLSVVCDEVRGKRILHNMCISYADGEVAGNLCKDVCSTGQLVIEQCLSHKNDNVIFSADWRGKKIILKSKLKSTRDKWQETFPDSLTKDLTTLRKDFLSVFHDHIILQLINFNSHRNHSLFKLTSPARLLAQLYFNMSPASLGRKEMQSLWSLLQQDEYFVFQILQNLTHIPRIYGTCGQFYALEKVKTLNEYIFMNGFNLLSNPLSWKTNVKIALDIMKLVRELKNSKTVYGSWHHCDIQPSNFGVDENGVVKAIDVDLMYTTEKILEILSQQYINCTTNVDCEFFDCVAVCNTRSKKCTSKKLSNNLQVVCRDLFITKWIGNGLLANIPLKSKVKFNKILKECSAATNLPWRKHNYQRIFDTLYGYLEEEIASFN